MQAVAPNFSNKTKTVDTVVLTENNIILKDEQVVANTFNNYFTDLTNGLNLKKTNELPKDFLLSDLVDSFNSCESVTRIKETHKTGEIFSFSDFSEEEVIYTIKNLPNNKASVLGDIPVKVLKQTIDKFASTITRSLNNCLENEKFPDVLKLADIPPVF